jgi:hypothetical protein
LIYGAKSLHCAPLHPPDKVERLRIHTKDSIPQ